MDEDNLHKLLENLSFISDVHGLAALLGTSYSKIKFFYYRQSIASHYTKFTIPKKSGGVRVILSPSPRLKTLQKRLSNLLSKLYKPDPSAYGFIVDRSIVGNAKSHIRRKWVFNIDLEDFFPTITFRRVRAMLIAPPYNLPPEVSSVIAHLTTVNGKLPQGSPCSPVLSNMICSSMDRELRILAMRHKASYTRYADDITFSFYVPEKFVPEDIVLIEKTEDGISHHSAKVGEVLQSIVDSKGFIINQKKVRLQKSNEKQVVTGLVVNKKVNVDRRYIRKTSALINSIAVLGVEQANLVNRSKNPDCTSPLEAHLYGRMLYINQVKGIDCPVYRRLALRFNDLDTSYKLPMSRPKIIGPAEHSALNIRRCWILEYPKYGIQATAFMLEDNLLVTCAHVFKYEFDLDVPAEIQEAEALGELFIVLDNCTAYRVDDRSKKYDVKVAYTDKHRDVAILKFGDVTEKFEFFRVEADLQPVIGDEVSIWGFPGFKMGSKDVFRFWATVNGRYASSAIENASIDKVMYAGNSGGPVLNLNQHVVGVVRRGAANDPSGVNEFLCSCELLKVLDNYSKSIIPV